MVIAASRRPYGLCRSSLSMSMRPFWLWPCWMRPIGVNGFRGHILVGAVNRGIKAASFHFALTFTLNVPIHLFHYSTSERHVPECLRFLVPHRPSLTYFVVLICSQIINGVHFAGCDHFVSMDTDRQDCFRPNCTFSCRHAHQRGCNSPYCIRQMDLPLRRATHSNPTLCSECQKHLRR
ncbi:hypothetical protein BDV98DRAFT_28759 [Pterulicium gracile]|uniref:Uncharacterized protein n=1 Tax=Pterulicium gracile TaxID=1884261 RepID=A0A5C3R309_9AGAR|nr:hypothetical protein BDV98DRAFT_28759 [Pterula gracilis]